MKLILYNNFSESNKLDKTIVKIVELDGNLREASSLINPSIFESDSIIKLDDISHGNTQTRLNS